MKRTGHQINLKAAFLATTLCLIFKNEVAAEHKGRSAEPWPYGEAPLTFRVAEAWGFFGTHTINGTQPPDNVLDPSLKYVSQQLMPSGFVIFRYLDSPWGGPWDQIMIEGSSAKVDNGPVAARVTQAFASAVPATLPSFPLHIPSKLAKFDWTHRSDGANDLKIYSPPDSTDPVLSIFGLSRVPFITFPITPNFFVALNLDVKFLQTVVDQYGPDGKVLGHILVGATFDGTGGIGIYSRYETSDALDLDGGFYNAGFNLRNATVTFTTTPYPSA